eukprot:CAMPEP_0180573878 /NCGR_PEP_ID=MMETSP1037_2-20121125/10008_1 /TAXON_ID=632150 /ORGANISM="Azadinium spinosum, Strain 3D9" /LENGTH=40 /DNA_ID= /DNA_START= /DNA_END= /DNA_ORIENTATION=
MRQNCNIAAYLRALCDVPGPVKSNLAATCRTELTVHASVA